MYLWLNGRLRECFGREVNLPFGEPRVDPLSSVVLQKRRISMSSLLCILYCESRQC
ncbi:hypothetical protein Plhal304r1_c006g0023331 [Plasmopara halstedii]